MGDMRQLKTFAYVLFVVSAHLPILSSCGESEGPVGASTPVGATDSVLEVRMLALGDSYTIGQSVSYTLRWPAQLADSLLDYGIKITGIKYIARTGWRTTDLLEAIEEFTTNGSYQRGTTYDLVTLLIGVNNQFRGMDLAVYEGDFNSLVDTAVVFAGGDPGRVFVLSIPDYGVTPLGASLGADRIGKEIDLYNDVNRRISAEKGVVYVDITAVSRLAGVDLSLVAQDGLHYSGVMYAKWVALVIPVVVEALGAIR
jgi:lysophospholipase L1-like esterase